MDIPTLDILVLLAYAALGTDLLIEIGRVRRRRSSADISPLGTMVRTTAAAIILIKLTILGDIELIVGQWVMLFLLGIYLLHVIRYQRKRK